MVGAGTRGADCTHAIHDHDEITRSLGVCSRADCAASSARTRMQARQCGRRQKARLQGAIIRGEIGPAKHRARSRVDSLPLQWMRRSEQTRKRPDHSDAREAFQLCRLAQLLDMHSLQPHTVQRQITKRRASLQGCEVEVRCDAADGQE